jgi:aspartate/methionine/tyrosine aminotransferase
MKLVKKMDRIGTESAFEVLAKAQALEKQGKASSTSKSAHRIFRLQNISLKPVRKALDEGWTKYGPTAGLLEFREAIAAQVSATRGVKVGPDNVCVVPGGKPIMFFVMMALLEEGDEVVYPDPSFPIYESLISFLGAVPKPVPLVESRGFSFDLNVLKDQLSSRTRLVILNSPANPTGGVISKEDLRQIADMLRERDLMILSDEIYCRIFYEQEPSSITSFEGILDKTVILDGFSKTYSMTGWRLGFGVMPQKLADAVNLLMVNSNSCTATFTQKAGLAALQGPQDDVTTMVAEFRKRRDVIVKRLNEIPGFRCTTPAGAFYAFPNVTGTGISSKELADLLLYEAGVACLNGTAFGKHGDGYLRFSYANSLANIEEAVRRIKEISGRWAKP